MGDMRPSPGGQGLAGSQRAVQRRLYCQFPAILLFGLLMPSQYLEKMYGIKDTGDAESEDGDDDDIEAAIQKEVAAIKDKGKGDNEDHHFIPMKMNVDCLLFFKTKAPVEPVEFARRICADAKAREPDQFKCRYVNRLTPVTVIGKASEAGLIEVARKALSPFFKLNAPTEAPAPEEGEKGDAGPSEGQAKDGNESIAPVAEQAGREYKPSTVSCLLPFWALHSNRYHSLPFGHRSAITVPSRGTL